MASISSFLVKEMTISETAIFQETTNTLLGDVFPEALSPNLLHQIFGDKIQQLTLSNVFIFGKLTA